MIEEEIKVLTQIKSRFKRNSIQEYLINIGGIKSLTKKFKNLKHFTLALERAGYSRRYIRDLKDRYKDLWKDT